MILYKIVFADDLSVNESCVLALLWHKKDAVISRRIIARSFHLTERTITNIFNNLQEKNYIKRQITSKNGDFLVYKTFFKEKALILYTNIIKPKTNKSNLPPLKDGELSKLFNKAVYGK